MVDVLLLNGVGDYAQSAAKQRFNEPLYLTKSGVTSNSIF